MATAPTYCTHRDLKDVFPQIDSFDSKTPIYGWVSTDTTHFYKSYNTGLITQMFFDGIEGTAVTDDPNANYEFRYSGTVDSVEIFLTTSAGAVTDPNDHLIEGGEDFQTLIARITANASRYLDSKLDPNLPKEQLKDKEGNFDYFIRRTTALIGAVFMIRSQDPTSEIANAMMAEAQDNIDALNKGTAALSWQTTGDSSKGVIREVGTISGGLRPVDTRGRYYGTWDLIQLKVTGGGVLGTATYSVFVKDSDKLKATEVVANRKISGDYQPLAGGLRIRFAGSDDSASAALNDEWEIEVSGAYEEVDNSTMNSVTMTRR